MLNPKKENFINDLTVDTTLHSKKGLPAWEKWGELTSGETTQLASEQSQFNSWLKDDDEIWVYEPEFDNKLSLQNHFFTYVADHVKSIPAHQFLLRYLLYRYNLAPGEKNIHRLSQYVGMGKWRISDPGDLNSHFKQLHMKLSRATGSPEVVLDHADFNAILSAICYALQTEYPDTQRQAVLGKSKKWSTYFNSLLKKPSLNRLRELALALNWNWDTYAMFRKKALKNRSLNYLEYEELLMFLSLRYAPVCSLSCYPAYCFLAQTYSKKSSGLTADKARKLLPSDAPDTSARMGSRFQQLLETDGQLTDYYQKSLFTVKDNNLEKLLSQAQILRAARKTRSCQEVLVREWNNLKDDLIKEDYIEGDSRHYLFRELYGKNVEKQITGKSKKGKNRRGIVDISDKDMVRIAPKGKENYYLDSQEFLDTRIRDNDFYEKTFTVDEIRQRNLLLTVVFLNFLSTLGNYDSYEDRLANFDMAVTDILTECGFLSLYSGYAYDTLLKLLLSCDDPMGLFQFIWHVKTGSLQPESANKELQK